MCNLISRISNLLRDRNLWDYYSNNNFQFSIEDINNVNKCYEFINSYIKDSRKETIHFNKYLNALRSFKEKDIEGYRMRHIVSLFFIGLVFFGNNFIKDKIKNEIEEIGVFSDIDNLDKEFVFVWFLTCIFHDIGYVFENDITSNELTIEEIHSESSSLRNLLPSIVWGNMPNHYNLVISKYLYYRKSKDHGIMGGLSFAKNVCELRKIRYNNQPEGERYKWKPELDKLYKYIGCRICCHNIFYVRMGIENLCNNITYIISGLCPLILNGKKDMNGKYVQYPLHFTKQPLFFLLCLIDSIDPMKICGQIPKDLSIDITSQGEVTICCNNADFIKRISAISEWLVSVTSDNKSITFVLD